MMKLDKYFATTRKFVMDKYIKMDSMQSKMALKPEDFLKK